MTYPGWPVVWPTTVDSSSFDPRMKEMAENYSVSILRHLTLGRIGGEIITVMPCASSCRHPHSFYSFFHPILLDSGAYANCFCHGGCNCDTAPTVILEGPVGRIDEVKINGVVLPNTAYRVEDSNRLVRIDGGGWPACAGVDFTVTYLNSYVADDMAQYAAGIFAHELYKSFTGGVNCRLPKNTRSITRQGITMEFSTELFPEGRTGVKEVDFFIIQWNPYGAKSPSIVASLDYPMPRRITWSAP